MLSAAAPQFLVDNLQASIEYYTQILGFSLNIQYKDSYASVLRDEAEIHLKAAAKLPEERALRLAEQHIDAYIWVDNFNDVFREFQSSGAIFLYPPTEQPWGVTDFYLKDIDDYIICFGQR